MEVAEFVAEYAPPTPASMPKRTPQAENHDPERYILLAKAIVVQNFNEHRENKRVPELSMDTVYVESYSKALGNWRVFVASPDIRGMLWEVTYNGHKNEAYVNIYKRIANAKVSLGDPK